MANKKTKAPIAKPVTQNKQQTQASIPDGAETENRFSLNLKLACLLGLVSLIVYANTLKNGFVLDDCTVITKNTIVTQGVSAIPEILSTPYRRGYHLSPNDLYRPLTLVMFAVEYQFFGSNPMPYHLVNILLFAGCIILLFFFLDRFFDRKKTAVAFIASLLFALHPLHTEVVANIKSRDELLCFFFSFSSLLVFIKYMQSGKMAQLMLGAFCFFLSLLSKETVITFLAVIPLIFLFYQGENRKMGIYITISAVVVAVIFLAIRLSILSYYHANSIAVVDIIDNALAKRDLPYVSRVATAILILGYYIKLMFIPYPLICDYSYNTIPYVEFNDPGVLISLAFYVFLAIFAFRRFLKNHKDPYAFGILFFLITLSLFTNIPFLLGTTMGERLMFFPSLGFCIVVALLIEKFAVKPGKPVGAVLKQPKLLLIIIPVSVLYSIIVINRNNDWLSNYTLYSADANNAPESAKLNYWLGLEMELTVFDEEKDREKRKSIITDAITHLRKSLAIDPAFEDAQVTIGHAYSRNGQYDSAEYHDKMAVTLNPKKVDAMNNLAGVYFAQQKYPLAIETYKKAIDLNPNFVNPYANIAACYGSLGIYDSTILFAKKAIAVNSGFKVSYEMLASTYKMMGNPDSSKKYELIAQKNNPAFKL